MSTTTQTTRDAELASALDAWLRTGRTGAFKKLETASRLASLAALLAAVRATLMLEGDAAAVVRSNAACVLAFALRARPGRDAADALVELVEHPDGLVSGYACDVVLGRASVAEHGRSASAAAERSVLNRVALHFAPRDRLLGAAVAALHLLGTLDLPERLTALDDGSEHFAGNLVAVFRQTEMLVALTPAWWDLYQRRLPHFAGLVADTLSSRASPTVLVHALASGASKLDDAILEGLQLRADRAIGDALAAVLPRLGPRSIAREIEAILARLETSSASTPVPVEEGGAGTDGGPVLLASESALAGWRGARADGAHKGDYHEACSVADRVASLERSEGSVFVLPATAVGVMRPPNETSVWLLLAGTLESAWTRRESLRFLPLGLSVDARTGTLWLHDAALAGVNRDSSFALAVGRSLHTLEEARTDDGLVRVVRLVPRMKRRNPRKPGLSSKSRRKTER